MDRENLSSSYRRSYYRFTASGSLELCSPKNCHAALILKDVSARGLGIISNVPFEKGDVLILILRSSLFTKPLRLTAKVIWCRMVDEKIWRIGLDFGLLHRIRLQ